MDSDVRTCLRAMVKALDEQKRLEADRALRHARGSFICEACHKAKGGGSMNIVLRRDKLGLEGRKRHRVCCKCYILGQDKYIMLEPSRGIHMAAVAMEKELKEM